jgi:hypothetical protein
MTWPNIFRVCFSWIIEHLCKILWNSTSTIYFWPHWPLTPTMTPRGLSKLIYFDIDEFPESLAFQQGAIRPLSIFDHFDPLTPDMTPKRSLKNLFRRRWISRVFSFPTRYFTTNIYFWPYWPLTPNMTLNGSFSGPKTCSIRFLVKNRSNVQIFMKIAQAAFFQRTTGLVLSDRKGFMGW